MEYENSVHLPQQIENLLHQRAEGDIDGFEHILQGIKIMMKDEQMFITGLIAYSNKKEKLITQKAKECRKKIYDAWSGVSDLEGCQIVQQHLSVLEAGYNQVMIDYMNDVTETIMSYDERRTDE